MLFTREFQVRCLAHLRVRHAAQFGGGADSEVRPGQRLLGAELTTLSDLVLIWS